MLTYPVNFIGGPIDGTVREVLASEHWDDVRKVGVIDERGEVFATYRWFGGEISAVLDNLDTAYTSRVDFIYAPELELEPGENARLIRYYPEGEST